MLGNNSNPKIAVEWEYVIYNEPHPVHFHARGGSAPLRCSHLFNVAFDPHARANARVYSAIPLLVAHANK